MPIDYSQYPPNWKQLRQQVIERAENRCEFCGVVNHALIHRYGKGANDWRYIPDGMAAEAESVDGVKVTKVILTVAHLDHDKHNHEVSIDRLRALCQKCHLGYDLSRHINNRKYGRNHLKNQTKLFDQ